MSIRSLSGRLDRQLTNMRDRREIGQANDGRRTDARIFGTKAVDLARAVGAETGRNSEAAGKSSGRSSKGPSRRPEINQRNETSQAPVQTVCAGSPHCPLPDRSRVSPDEQSTEATAKASRRRRRPLEKGCKRRGGHLTRTPVWSCQSYCITCKLNGTLNAHPSTCLRHVAQDA